MTITEAQDLAFDIRSETGAFVNVRQIGNGEWVVLVNNLIVWNANDWEKVKGAV